MLRTALHTPPRAQRDNSGVPAQRDGGIPKSADVDLVHKWLDKMIATFCDQLDCVPATGSAYTLDGLIAVAEIMVSESELVCSRLCRAAKRDRACTAPGLYALLNVCLKGHL